MTGDPHSYDRPSLRGGADEASTPEDALEEADEPSVAEMERPIWHRAGSTRAS